MSQTIHSHLVDAHDQIQHSNPDATDWRIIRALESVMAALGLAEKRIKHLEALAEATEKHLTAERGADTADTGISSTQSNTQ